MRVDKNGNWAIASRDLFKGTGCEHCVRLSMAVEAKLPDVVAKVKPYEEDLSQKLPIIQGNQRERMVFDQIRASLPEGDFVEFDRATAVETIAALKNSTPVVAQGYFARELGGYFWSGYADLLVLEGFEIRELADGTVAAVQVGPVPDEPKYMAWDVKNSSTGDEKYQVQLATYLEALQELGLASENDLGIVLGFGRGVVRYSPEESLGLYRVALARLVSILNQASPAAITADFLTAWSCAKGSVCAKVYCDYPKLCKATFKVNHVLELLPNVNYRHSPKLIEAGFTDVTKLADCTSAPEVPGLKAEYSERYWKAAQVMQLEFDGHLALISKIAGTPNLPAATDQDVFFDVEWANPVDASSEFVFMFGVVGADEKFDVFTADSPADELRAFDEFLDYGMARLNANPEMHIYHFHNPEPQKVNKLVERYNGHRKAEADALIARMVDLKPVANDAFIPGSGSYSIKDLEKYYDADTKLNRGGLVSGGADAMLQFELFRQAIAAGDTEKATQIMQVIADYNKDDCLSTKLLRDWLSSLKFERIDQIVQWD
jgi:predicted RecB family nuclease